MRALRPPAWKSEPELVEVAEPAPAPVRWWSGWERLAHATRTCT